MRPIALLTDFGTRDWYVGVLHAVLEREAPGCARIDISHAVAAGDVTHAVFFLGCAWESLPADAVVLVVVDPGVGTGRRAVAARCGGRWIVGPDNGVAGARGAPDELWSIEPEKLDLGLPSNTFHGRDLFAPAAARLARGDAAATLGQQLDPASAERPPCGEEAVRVIHVDRFGNCITGILAADAPSGARLAWSNGVSERRVPSYGHAEPGRLVTLEGSSGHLEIACVNGSAAATTGLQRGDAVSLVPENEETP